MGFYQEYLNLVNIDEDIINPELSDPKFRNMILDDNKISFDIIKLFADGVKHTLKKPQRLLHDDENYYICIDMFTNTYYVCYKTLLMVDIDFYKKDEKNTTEDIIKMFTDYCKDKPELKFRLYSSRNGIHGFLISQKSDSKSSKDIQIMIDLESDFYYTVYAYLRGWSVRLNRKKTDSDTLYKYICDIGEGNDNEDLINLVNLHINLVDTFKNTKPNTM